MTPKSSFVLLVLTLTLLHPLTFSAPASDLEPKLYTGAGLDSDSIFTNQFQFVWFLLFLLYGLFLYPDAIGGRSVHDNSTTMQKILVPDSINSAKSISTLGNPSDVLNGQAIGTIAAAGFIVVLIAALAVKFYYFYYVNMHKNENNGNSQYGYSYGGGQPNGSGRFLVDLSRFKLSETLRMISSAKESYERSSVEFPQCLQQRICISSNLTSRVNYLEDFDTVLNTFLTTIGLNQPELGKLLTKVYNSSTTTTGNSAGMEIENEERNFDDGQESCIKRFPNCRKGYANDILAKLLLKLIWSFESALMFRDFRF